MLTEENLQPKTRGEAMRRVQTGLRQLTQRLHQLNDAAGSHIDLSPGDLEVLDMIAREGPMAPRDIIATTGIHPATMTGVLDRLENGSWLTRRPDPTDRRRLIVEAATERGGEIVRLYTPMSKAIGGICADYTDEELAKIIEFLGRVADAAVVAASDLRNSPD